ncbi:uncharacterized protein LTR77_010331 [Saxophila tyrrhenica]|uniref:MYND-type domain-containing protein n=1 Tax=Saxophila tyrrhenica TaxID=1690608 RepID=A0AAV9NVV1_9PEZI|nr:hypothetical protein LTR77_010331 [Saxophila tyrrhenica]
MAATGMGCCHVCGKEASQRCSKCGEGVDRNGNPSATFYCSRDCQTTDWENHKTTTCRFANARKQLYRGSSMVQMAFYNFRTTTFNFNIQKTSIGNDGKISVTIKTITTSGQPIHRLPEQLKSDKHKKALLAWRASNTALAFQHDLLKRVLKGIVDPQTPPTESAFLVKDFRERVAVIPHFANGRQDERQHEHVALRVKLIDGEEYVIDLAGAQFGQYAAVLPAKEYDGQLVREQLATKPMGSWKRFWSNFGQAGGHDLVPEEFEFRGPTIAFHSSAFAELALRQWDRRAVRTVAAGVKEKKAVFIVGRKCVLSVVSEYTSLWVHLISSQDGPISRFAAFIQVQPHANNDWVAWAPIKTSDIHDVDELPEAEGPWSPQGLQPTAMAKCEQQMQVLRSFIDRD